MVKQHTNQRSELSLDSIVPGLPVYSEVGGYLAEWIYDCAGFISSVLSTIWSKLKEKSDS